MFLIILNTPQVIRFVIYWSFTPFLLVPNIFDNCVKATKIIFIFPFKNSAKYNDDDVSVMIIITGKKKEKKNDESAYLRDNNAVTMNESHSPFQY